MGNLENLNKEIKKDFENLEKMLKDSSKEELNKIRRKISNAIHSKRVLEKTKKDLTITDSDRKKEEKDSIERDKKKIRKLYNHFMKE